MILRVWRLAMCRWFQGRGERQGGMEAGAMCWESGKFAGEELVRCGDGGCLVAMFFNNSIDDFEGVEVGDVSVVPGEGGAAGGDGGGGDVLGVGEVCRRGIGPVWRWWVLGSHVLQ